MKVPKASEKVGLGGKIFSQIVISGDIGSQPRLSGRKIQSGLLVISMRFFSFADSPYFIHACKCRYYLSGSSLRQWPGEHEKTNIERKAKSWFA